MADDANRTVCLRNTVKDAQCVLNLNIIFSPFFLCTTEIPSFEDIEMDPAYAWKILTGESREDVNCDEVFKECIRRTGSRKESTARYKLVESTYVRALAKGYICEIQEISRIKDAGVLVTLNEYDRAGARIRSRSMSHPHMQC